MQQTKHRVTTALLKSSSNRWFSPFPFPYQWQDICVVGLVQLDGNPHLSQIGSAGGDVSRTLSSRKRRQQKRSQNGNDRNDQQQLDKREGHRSSTGLLRMSYRVHFTLASRNKKYGRTLQPTAIEVNRNGNSTPGGISKSRGGSASHGLRSQRSRKTSSAATAPRGGPSDQKTATAQWPAKVPGRFARTTPRQNQ